MAEGPTPAEALTTTDIMAVVDPNYANFDYQALLDRSGQPVQNLVAGRNALLTHQLQSAETQKAAEVAFKRQMEAMREQENFRAQEAAAAEGLTNDDGTPIKDVGGYGKAKKGRLVTSAIATADFLKNQMEALNEKQRNAVDNITKIASSPIGTGKGPEAAEQRRQALKSALESPAAKEVPDDLRAKLWGIVSSNGDPANVMDDVVQRMQKFWGSKGVRESTRYNNAATFLQAYLDPLKTTASATQQNQLAAAASVLQATNQEIERTVTKAQDHMASAAPFLPDSYKKDLIGIGGLKNPAGALGDLVKPAAGGSGNASGVEGDSAAETQDAMGGGAVSSAPPAPTPAGVPPVDVGSAMEQGGVYSAIPALRQNLMAKNDAAKAFQSRIADKIISTVADPIQGMFQTGGGSAPAPNLGQIVAARAKADLQANPNPKAIPANPAEIQAVHQLNAQLFPGADQSKMDAGVAAGSPAFVAGFNTLLKIVRSKMAGGGVPPVMPPTAMAGPANYGAPGLGASNIDFSQTPPVTNGVPAMVGAQ